MRFWPRHRLSTPAAVSPVVKSVRSTGCGALPVKNTFSMALTWALKKLQRVLGWV